MRSKDCLCSPCLAPLFTDVCTFCVKRRRSTTASGLQKVLEGESIRNTTGHVVNGARLRQLCCPRASFLYSAWSSLFVLSELEGARANSSSLSLLPFLETHTNHSWLFSSDLTGSHGIPLRGRIVLFLHLLDSTRGLQAHVQFGQSPATGESSPM